MTAVQDTATETRADPWTRERVTGKDRRLAIGRERAAFRKAVLHSDLSPGAKLRALAYESYAGDGLDRVWVSDENLALMTGQKSLNTRKKHSAELIARRVLVLVEPGNSARGTSPVYSLHYRHLSAGKPDPLAGKPDPEMSTFDAPPSFSDKSAVKNWSPKGKHPKTRKYTSPSGPDAASGAERDYIRDEIIANAGEPVSDEEAEWHERIIDLAAEDGDELGPVAASMLARGEHPAKVVATLKARLRDYAEVPPW